MLTTHTHADSKALAGMPSRASCGMCNSVIKTGTQLFCHRWVHVQLFTLTRPGGVIVSKGQRSWGRIGKARDGSKRNWDAEVNRRHLPAVNITC